MFYKIPLVYVIFSVIFASASYAYKAIINDVQDLRTSSLINVTSNGEPEEDDLMKYDWTQSSKCKLDLEYIISQLEKVRDGQRIPDWTLDLLDSIGKVPSNIGQGNIFWLGDHNLCQSVTSKERDFRGKYCLSLWHQPSNPSNAKSIIGPSGLRLGICLPDSCTVNETRPALAMYRKIMDFLPGASTLRNVTKRFTSIECQVVQKLTLGGQLCLLCILVSVVVTIVATKKDRLSRRNLKRDRNAVKLGEVQVPFWVTCFSLDTSLKSLRCPESKKEDLTFLSGLRFVSSLVMLSFHFFHYVMLVAANYLAWQKPEDTWFTFMHLVTLGPDLFFIYSGLLMSYWFFLDVQKGVEFNFIRFCLKRYLRLIYPVVILAWFFATVFPQLGSGPFWDTGKGHLSEVAFCQENWWRILLGIHNFISSHPIKGQCLLWTWQSFAELHLSILSPIYVFTLKRSLRKGILLIAVTTGLSLVANGFPMWLFGNTGYESFEIHLRMVHLPTWCRLGSYLIGITLGYAFATQKSTIDSMSKSMLNKITFSSAIISIYVILRPRTFPVKGNLGIFLFSVEKELGSIGVACFILSCFSGHLSTIIRFLCWKPLVQLSQLSYSVNLVHPLVFCYFLNQVSTSIVVTPTLGFLMLTGCLPVTLLASLIFYVLVESPMKELSRVQFSSSIQKKTE